MAVHKGNKVKGEPLNERCALDADYDNLHESFRNSPDYDSQVGYFAFLLKQIIRELRVIQDQLKEDNLALKSRKDKR